MRLPSRTITIRCYHPSYSYTDPQVAQFSNIVEYPEYGSTRSTSLGWNNQRRGQKRVVRLLPREIVRYTRGVEKFFPAKRRRRKFIVHRGRIKHAVPAVSSAGSTDPISSIRSLDPTERRIREFLEFLAAALRAGEGEGRGESLQMGGRETKQRRDRIFRWLCNSRRSPRPRRQLGSFFDRCGARNAAPRREISERVGGGGKRARPFPLYPTILDFYSSRYIHIYIIFIFTCDICVPATDPLIRY